MTLTLWEFNHSGRSCGCKILSGSTKHGKESRFLRWKPFTHASHLLSIREIAEIPEATKFDIKMKTLLIKFP